MGNKVEQRPSQSDRFFFFSLPFYLFQDVISAIMGLLFAGRFVTLVRCFLLSSSPIFFSFYYFTFLTGSIAQHQSSCLVWFSFCRVIISSFILFLSFFVCFLFIRKRKNLPIWVNNESGLYYVKKNGIKKKKWRIHTKKRGEMFETSLQTCHPFFFSFSA